MRQMVIRIVASAVLLSVAALATFQGRKLRDEAATRERLATLRYVGLDDRKADYWRGEYDRLTLSSATEQGSDPEILLLAANAAFRKAQRTAQPRQAYLQQLDSVLQTYASVLKSGGFMDDAAYNYEFVARMRELLGRNRSPSPSLPAVKPPARARITDLPSGPTIHGHPGGPPPGTKGEDFEIIAPMDYGDRESQPEPNVGGKPLRKG